MPDAPRLRQAVLAARDLDAVVATLREGLQLGEPFNDPAVAMFGLRNAVFAIGDTFLEVVSPTTGDASAARLLNRRGTDCGYMVMFQVSDFGAARERAGEQSIREVFAVDLDDMSEIHLHPADIGGAIVAISTPAPPESWRWGGPDWAQRSVPGEIKSVTIEHPEPEAVEARWSAIVGDVPAGIRKGEDRGPIEIVIERDTTTQPIEIGSVRISAARPT